jgi:hypothetical protein
MIPRAFCAYVDIREWPSKAPEAAPVDHCGSLPPLRSKDFDPAFIGN